MSTESTPTTADAFRAFEQQGWERAAGAFEAIWTRLTDQCREQLLDAAGVRVGTGLLDVACGPGRLVIAALERGAVVTAVDFAAAMVERARAAAPRAELREGDAEALAFADGQFDAVTCSFGVPHFSHPERALSEAHRVLRSGGRFAYSMWCTPDRAVAFGMVYDAVRDHGVLDVGLPEGPPMFRYGDETVSRSAMGAAGFTDVRMDLVPMTMRLEPGADLVSAFIDGTVRSSGLLRAQTPEALVRIRSAVDAALASYEVDDTIALPMPCWVVSGRKG